MKQTRPKQTRNDDQPPLNIVKLCVGVDEVDQLAEWQQRRIAENASAGRSPVPFHTTRMWPRRESEIVNKGSLYWVIRGVIRVRQTIIGMEESRGEDGIRRCRILLDPELVATELRTRRAFQGWRYLSAADAPRDLPKGQIGEETLPDELARGLADLGVH